MLKASFGATLPQVCASKLAKLCSSCKIMAEYLKDSAQPLTKSI